MLFRSARLLDCGGVAPEEALSGLRLLGTPATFDDGINDSEIKGFGRMPHGPLPRHGEEGGEERRGGGGGGERTFALIDEYCLLIGHSGCGPSPGKNCSTIDSPRRPAEELFIFIFLGRGGLICGRIGAYGIVPGVL